MGESWISVWVYGILVETRFATDTILAFFVAFFGKLSIRD